MSLTTAQSMGVTEIKRWVRKSEKQIFTLAGYAGTGKSYLTSHAIKELKLSKDEVAFCTFTGKASLVLMKYHNGNSNVSTIHRLVYEIKDDQYGVPYFELKEKLAGIKLIIIDEASMVNEELLNDLKSFGILILAIGDHGQLPAIGKQANLMENPDYVLTEIMRQAQDNPIIYLSMLAREGKPIPLGKYGDKVVVLSKHDPLADTKTMLRADQVICGYNNTRTMLNERLREARGFKGKYPEYGEKVIFLENNWSKFIGDFNLVNGMIGYVVNEPKVIYHDKAKMRVLNVSVQPDFLSGVFEDLYIPLEDFTDEKIQLTKWQRKFLDRMTFGDAITCHKAQGSQWENLFVWNEPFGDEPWRWTYTAITRAEERLILAV